MQEEVSYFDVESWGKLAETVADTGHKGRGVRVVGRLKQNRWTDQEGRNQSRIVIVAEHIEFRPASANANTTTNVPEEAEAPESSGSIYGPQADEVETEEADAPLAANF
jgi:single-strand DNA-binding protein